MLGRRRIDTPAPIRSSIADAAFAVEERLVWGGADVLRGIVEVVRWPFERAIWAIERGFVWPLEERSGDWSASVRVLGIAALVLQGAKPDFADVPQSSATKSSGATAGTESAAATSSGSTAEVAKSNSSS